MASLFEEDYRDRGIDSLPEPETALEHYMLALIVELSRIRVAVTGVRREIRHSR